MYKNRIDKPITSLNEDSLNIKYYKKGLVNYLENCNTPMTVSIQGEWGSGKTSLLNLIRNELKDNNHVFTINTWNYSLFEESQVPMKIFMDLLSALETELKDEQLISKFQNHKETFFKIGMAVTKVAAAKFTGGDSSALDEFGIGSKDLEDIKSDIETAISNLTEVNSKVIFLIDDLDRLNPELAIKILEVLKNLFDSKGSIFILAIDYEVIVKGLKKKFGDYEKNEREYRQFFDKIVQLPFTMPMEDYSLDKYLKDQLTSVKYFDNNKYLENEKNMNYLTEVCSLTIGNNPRAIKRVVNYLSLIDGIIEAKEDKSEYEDIKKALQFALISIQVAYPSVYKLLAKEPNYLEWNDDLLESVEDVNFENINFSEEQRILIDEEWEQTLYKYITVLENSYLTSKTLHILECLNLIREHISQEKVKSLIYEMIQISSVTSSTVNNIKVEQTDYSEIWTKINKNIDSKIHTDRKSATSNKIEIINNIFYSISIRKDNIAIFIDFKKSARTNKDKFDSLRTEVNDDKRIIFMISRSNNEEEWISCLKSKIDDIKIKIKD